MGEVSHSRALRMLLSSDFVDRVVLESLSVGEKCDVREKIAPRVVNVVCEWQDYIEAERAKEAAEDALEEELEARESALDAQED